MFMFSGNVSRAPTSVSRWAAAVILTLQDIGWLTTCCRWQHNQGLRLNTWHWYNWQAEDESVHCGASCPAETPPPAFCNSNSGLKPVNEGRSGCMGFFFLPASCFGNCPFVMSLTALPAVSDHTPSQGLAPPSLSLFLNVWKGQQCVISGRKLNPSVLVGGNKQRAKKLWWCSALKVKILKGG